MERPRIRLQINRHRISRCRRPVKEDLPVVHIGSLNRLSVDKYQKLRILGVVPLLNLSPDPKP